MHAPPRRLESAGSERKLNGHRPSEVAEEEEELAELDDDQDQLESEKRFYFILRETGTLSTIRPPSSFSERLLRSVFMGWSTVDLHHAGARHSTRRSYWEVLAHRLTATAKDAKANAVLLASIDVSACEQHFTVWCDAMWSRDHVMTSLDVDGHHMHAVLARILVISTSR